MTGIFISYRRGDSNAVAGRIYDRLQSRFGSKSVFMDVDKIPLGADFREYLSNAVNQCDVLIAVIGEKWLQTDQNGKSRLDDPSDFVRIEIETALARKIPVIPVLIGDTSMPSSDQLPPTLVKLVYRNATHVDPGTDFNFHIKRLIQGISKQSSSSLLSAFLWRIREQPQVILVWVCSYKWMVLFVLGIIVVSGVYLEKGWFEKAPILVSTVPKEGSLVQGNGTTKSTESKKSSSTVPSPAQQDTVVKAPPLSPVQTIQGWSAPQVQALQQQTAQALKMKVEFRDNLDNLKEGGQGPSMVVIPAGRFQMGSPDNEPERGKDERQHEVEVNAFAISKYEVTVGQFKRFVEAKHKTEAEKSGGCYYWTGSEWKLDADKNWRNPGFLQTDNHPVVCVSWNDAMEYVNWLSEQTGKQYHLPTEAEWEYAARAGTATPFYFGATINTAQANYNGNYVYDNGRKGVYRQKTVEVGQFPANAWGLHDMHGNVQEWTCSVYSENYDGSEQHCAELGTSSPCVLRGSSWSLEPKWLRGAARRWNSPLNWGDDRGFRLARTFP